MPLGASVAMPTYGRFLVIGGKPESATRRLIHGETSDVAEGPYGLRWQNPARGGDTALERAA